MCWLADVLHMDTDVLHADADEYKGRRNKLMRMVDAFACGHVACRCG